MIVEQERNGLVLTLLEHCTKEHGGKSGIGRFSELVTCLQTFLHLAHQLKDAHVYAKVCPTTHRAFLLIDSACYERHVIDKAIPICGGHVSVTVH